MKRALKSSLALGFLRAVEAFPERPALQVAGESFTYSSLFQKAASLAATLEMHDRGGNSLLTAVFGYRSVTAFASILGVLLRGHGYVPLNRTFPPDRTRQMLQRSKCRAMIVDKDSESQLGKLLSGVEDKMVLLCADSEDVEKLARQWPMHRFLGSKDVEPAEACSACEDSCDNAIAYLLFTSGSTGVPKGVMVAHRNVTHYVDWAVQRYEITERDRVSQTFDMTFDLSVHDMFVAWERGACVCCPTQKQLFKPNTFINDSRLTIWFSVPSTAVFMRRFGLLKPGMYPNLRLSIFCGEALPVDTVTQWAGAAPNSQIENIYGPTELTIACTAYRWDREASPRECELGLVPIGEPFTHMEAIIVDESLCEVPIGTPGELLLAGPQVTLGYWEDVEKTSKAFVVPPGRSKIYYRTGDQVRCLPLDKTLVYLGRIDNQVKILGHRVELGEVEAVVRRETGIDGVVAFGWPVSKSGAEGIEVFLQTENPIEQGDLRSKLRLELPTYMIPRRIHALPAFPLNFNGKFDRKALFKILENQP